MKRTTPTTWQYLLDNVSAARIKEAEATGDAKRIAEANRYYKDLSEDECEFTAPYAHPEKRGKFVTTLTCKARGFKINRLTFGTGDLYKMVEPNMSLMLTAKNLEVATVTNMYYIRETDRWHLLVHKDANIHEALKMSGYEYRPDEYKVTQFHQRNRDLLADGYVDVIGPVVAGRLYLTTVFRELYPEGLTPVAVEGKQETMVGKLAEGVKLATEVVSSGEALEEAKTPLEQIVERHERGEDVFNHGKYEADAAPVTMPEAAAAKSVAIQEAAKAAVPAEVLAEEEATPAPAEAPAKKNQVSFNKKNKR